MIQCRDIDRSTSLSFSVTRDYNLRNLQQVMDCYATEDSGCPQRPLIIASYQYLAQSLAGGTGGEVRV